MNSRCIRSQWFLFARGAVACISAVALAAVPIQVAHAADTLTLTLGTQQGTLTYGAAGSANFLVTIQCSGWLGVSTDLSLTETTLPSGAWASFNPSTLSWDWSECAAQTNKTSTLTIHTSSSSPPSVTTLKVIESNSSVWGLATLTINKATATLAVTNSPVTYNAAPQAATVMATYLGSLVPGTTSDRRYNGSNTTPTTVNTYTVTADFTPSSAYYNILSDSYAGHFSIQKKSATVMTDTASKIYGDADPTFTGSLTGFMPADGVTATYSRGAGESVATYTIAPTLHSIVVNALSNYSISLYGAPFSITRRSIGVYADAKSKIFGHPDPQLTYSHDPLMFSDAFSGSLGREAGEAVGTYEITQHTLALSANYTLVYHSGYLTIQPNSPPVIAEGTSKLVSMSVNGKPTPFSLMLHAADANGDTITWSISTPASHGIASASGTGTAKAVHYTPAANYMGTDNFVVRASDGIAVDTISINVKISPAALTFRSIGTHDGWVLESGEDTNIGGTLNSSATTLFVGDNAAKKQYRSILSFNTYSLPDQAVITKLQLKLTRQGIVGGGNPFSIFQGMLIDIKKGFFGSVPGLQLGDFQAAASKAGLGSFNPTPSGALYTINLPSTAFPYINKVQTVSGGLTQLRLRFKIDDNGNILANYISFYSGNAASANRPVLAVTFYAP